MVTLGCFDMGNTALVVVGDARDGAGVMGRVVEAEAEVGVDTDAAVAEIGVGGTDVAVPVAPAAPPPALAAVAVAAAAAVAVSAMTRALAMPRMLFNSDWLMRAGKGRYPYFWPSRDYQSQFRKGVVE